MPLAFQYPAPGGTGAVDGSGNLVTACGTYDAPAAGTAPYLIQGKICPVGTVCPPMPPTIGASVGTTTSMGLWHFNGCSPPMGGGALAVGTRYKLCVWIDTGASGFQMDEVEFEACLSGSGNCEPDCPAPAPQPPGGRLFGCEGIVITTIACRKFRVLPSAGVAGVMEVFGLPPLDLVNNIVLTFDENVSTHDRPIWVSPLVGGQRLRLEVARGGCCYEALMTRIRVKPFVVETLDRWSSTCFDIIEGGELCGLTASCQPRDGGVHLLPVGEVAPNLGRQAPSFPPPSKPAPKRSAKPRKTRRGRK